MSVPRRWRCVQMLRCRSGKRRVVRVDISDLDIDKALCVGRSRAKAFAQ